MNCCPKCRHSELRVVDYDKDPNMLCVGDGGWAMCCNCKSKVHFKLVMKNLTRKEFAEELKKRGK